MISLASLFLPEIRKGKIYFPELDALRTIAIFLVIFFHSTLLFYDFYFSNIWPKLSSPLLAFWYEGYVGVDLLFVLSGFLLTIPLLEKGEQHFSAGEFYKNRIKRIFPLYYCSVFLALYLFSRTDFSLSNILPYFLFLSNLSLPLAFLSHFEGVYWAIAVEVHFSLLFPWLVKMIKNNLFLIFLILSSVLLKLLVPTNIIFSSSIFGRIDQFVMGMLLAKICLQSNLPTTLHRQKYFAVVLLLAVIILANFLLFQLNNLGGYFIQNYLQALIHPLTALFWSIVILLFFSLYLNNHQEITEGKVIKYSLMQGVVSFVSKISYSMFIWHFPLAVFILEIYQKTFTWPKNDFGLIFYTLLMVVPVTILISTLSYLLVERPFLLKDNNVK